MALAAFAVLLVNVPSAAAGTATVSNGTLLYAGAPGEANSVGIAYDAVLHAYKITDETAPVTGGEGVDRIDAAGDGAKTVDCQGRDDEVIEGGSGVTRQNCAPAPQITITAARAKPARVLARKFAFSVGCDRPCAVYWELRVG